MGRFLPPDHAKGDESTVGGYAAVHARPPAFEGADGLSYSVSVEVDDTGERAGRFGAYLLFVRWGRGEPQVTGHLETDYLARADTEQAAADAVGALPLAEAKRLLDERVRERAAPAGRPWWEAMRDESDA